MDPRCSSAQARGDDAGPSSMARRDFDALLRNVTQQVMSEMVRSLGGWSYMIEQFTRMRPPSFSRGADPLVAENWVQDIKDIMVILPCTDEQKVLFATFKLTGEAKRWWRSTRLLEEQRPDPVMVMSYHFREIFYKRYFLVTVMSAKAAEFLHLTQEPMTVQQYVARFIKLSRFAPYLVPDEERRARKFAKGLRQSLYEQVIGFWAQTFAEVVDRVRVIEGGFQKGTAT
ncbi:uncharacterized protein LOC131148227 [Malania oleifera]|uniref:uncharacterized protein LOC131148227 n=1 Tax=Malania oleifera TaxID=397392 RepID=UPI0025ADBE88|nr:uncharacterized protein LOC131148227 [Malania oleifera]